MTHDLTDGDRTTRPTYTRGDLRHCRSPGWAVGAGGWGGNRMPVTAKPQELLTLAEAAEYLRVHRRTMSRLLRQRVVPGTKIGRQWRVRAADLDAVLAGGTAGEPQANGTEQGEVRDPASRVTRDGHAS